MSRNADKIKKALAAKGYAVGEMRWDPVGHAVEMCGPEGGWYVEVVFADDPEKYFDRLLAYSTAEALETIEGYPDALSALAGKEGEE